MPSALTARTQYFFEFDAPFFINEDIELLKLMGLDAVTGDEASVWLPSELYSYCSQHPGNKIKKPTIRQSGLMSSPGGVRYSERPHFMRPLRQGPMSDILSHHTVAEPKDDRGLGRRFRETLSTLADISSSPVI